MSRANSSALCRWVPWRILGIAGWAEERVPPCDCHFVTVPNWQSGAGFRLSAHPPTPRIRPCTRGADSWTLCLDAPLLGNLLALPANNVVEQPLGSLLQGHDIGANRVERAQRLRLVKVAGKADLVADLGGRLIPPGIGRIRQHFAAQERLYSALFQQRYLLGVAQVGIGFVFDDAFLAGDGRFVSAAQPIRRCLARLVGLGDNGRGRLDTLADGSQEQLQFRAGQFSL